MSAGPAIAPQVIAGLIGLAGGLSGSAVSIWNRRRDAKATEQQKWREERLRAVGAYLAALNNLLHVSRQARADLKQITMETVTAPADALRAARSHVNETLNPIVLLFPRPVVKLAVECNKSAAAVVSGGPDIKPATAKHLIHQRQFLAEVQKLLGVPDLELDEPS